MGDEYIVYYDHYRDPKHYGAVASKDLAHWSSITDKISFPAGAKHGSFLKISEKEARRLQANAWSKP